MDLAHSKNEQCGHAHTGQELQWSHIINPVFNWRDSYYFCVVNMTRFVLSLTLCYFVLVFFSPFSIAITSLREERDNLSAFRTFVRVALV